MRHLQCMYLLVLVLLAESVMVVVTVPMAVHLADVWTLLVVLVVLLTEMVMTVLMAGSG